MGRINMNKRKKNSFLYNINVNNFITNNKHNRINLFVV